MRKITSGFTIIELLVVIAVIGILTTISALSFTRYQADARDSQRDQRATIIVEALEKYFSKNGEYPSCSAMTNSASYITANVLPGIDTTALVAPQSVGQTNSIDFCTTITTATPTDSFAYVGDGSAACTGSGSCLEYTLQYKQETTNTIKSVTSRHNAKIATSGAITNLAGSANQFSSASLTWASITNAANYTLQVSTVIGFGTIYSTSTPTTNSATVTGLTPGTTYYFRVLPNAPSSIGDWSNTLTLAIPHIATPVPTATYNASNPTTQLDLSWGAISGVATYTINWQTVNNGFSSNYTNVTNITGTSWTLTGLTAGTTVYFRIKAVAPDDQSSYSSSVNATTIVPAPATLTATTNSPTQITVNWGAVAVANTYNIEFALNPAFTGSSFAATGVTGTSRAITGLTQGQIYYFKVYALVGAVSSLASPTANATTTINNPTSVSVNSVRPGAIRPYGDGDWVAWIDSPSSGNWYYAYGTASGTCPSGSTIQYQHASNYNSPTTQYGYTGWSGIATKYMVQPNSGYSIRFLANVRCVGPSGVISGSVNAVSGYAANP